MPHTTRVIYNSPVDGKILSKIQSNYMDDFITKSILKIKLQKLCLESIQNNLLKNNDEIDMALNEISQETFGYLDYNPQNKRIY
jgi:hypothetical protein